ncbi:MAG: hypothetical protein ACK559_12630, partial [bacterium]
GGRRVGRGRPRQQSWHWRQRRLRVVDGTPHVDREDLVAHDAVEVAQEREPAAVAQAQRQRAVVGVQLALALEPQRAALQVEVAHRQPVARQVVADARGLHR